MGEGEAVWDGDESTIISQKLYNQLNSRQIPLCSSARDLLPSLLAIKGRETNLPTLNGFPA
jgi:hypothetical protein